MKYLFSLALLLLTIPLGAQRHQTFNDRIQSVTVIANDNWQSLPIYELDNGAVSIDFDDLTHKYHRYAYRLEHCEADWTPSDQLFESDFCEGFAFLYGLCHFGVNIQIAVKIHDKSSFHLI